MRFIATSHECRSPGRTYTECKGNRITIAVDMDLTGSMLEMEDEILQAVNAMGNLASGEALKRFDTDGGNLTIGGMTWYLKGQQEKTYQLPYRMVKVGMHVYQRAEGSTTLCPLDDKARGVDWNRDRWDLYVVVRSRVARSDDRHYLAL